MRSLLIKGIAIALFLSIGISCNKDEGVCMENPQPDCACGYYLNPVCGCNGKTYPNGCVAACAGIAEVTMGECE